MPLDAGLLEAKERAEAAFGQKEDTHRAGPGRGAPWCRPFGGGGCEGWPLRQQGERRLGREWGVEGWDSDQSDEMIVTACL